MSTSECLHFVCVLKGHFTGCGVPGPPSLALWRLPTASRSFISGKEPAVSHAILLRVMRCFSSAAVHLLFVQGALQPHPSFSRLSCLLCGGGVLGACSAPRALSCPHLILQALTPHVSAGCHRGHVAQPLPGAHLHPDSTLGWAAASHRPSRALRGVLPSATGGLATLVFHSSAWIHPCSREIRWSQLLGSLGPFSMSTLE